MSPKIPARIMTIGALALMVSIAAAACPFLSFLGRSTMFEWGCDLVTALTFSTGMFLSLCGLLTPGGKRAAFFELHLIGLLTFCVILAFYFVGFVTLSRVYHQWNEFDAGLPALVEGASTGKSEANRAAAAREAYTFYATTIPYRLDTGAVGYYQPTAEEITEHHRTQVDMALNRELLRGQLQQFPWLFIIYLGSFFAVYLGGTLWLLLKRPGP